MIKGWFYKILHKIAWLLIFTKRTLFWFIGVLGSLAGKFIQVYNQFLGYRIYKLLFFTKKRLAKWRILGGEKFVELFSGRGFLQIVFFLVALIIMFPHSKLYTEHVNVPGSQTLLYRIIGPPENELQEISSDSLTAFTPYDDRSWREGSLSSGDTLSSVQFNSGSDITSLVVGGSAVSKPNIIPGADLERRTGAEIPNNRSSIIEYVVQSGDVISLIAKRYNISVATLLWSNNLSERSLIRPGDKLKILPVDGVVHTVKKGDTVGKIARLYKSDEAKIIDFNKLQSDGRDIVIGEDLIIPGGQRPTPVYVPSATRRYNSLSGVAAPPSSISSPAGSGYIWPSSARIITQYFGLRHNGLDIAGKIGSYIYASRAGKVITSKCGWNGGYGCHVVIDHGGGVTSLYAHAKTLYVSPGDSVEQGDLIALMGSTGNSTGPHVHFEIRINKIRQNPLRYVR